MKSWYEALMGLRNGWVVCKRIPKNLCKKCLLKANCSKFCPEISAEVLGEVIDQVGIGMKITNVKISQSQQDVNIDMTFQPDTAVEKIDLRFFVDKTTKGIGVRKNVANKL